MKQMTKSEKIIFAAILALVSAAAFFVRTLGFSFLTIDMKVCLIPWSAEMPAGQGISVLKNYSGDYNMTYITVLWLLNYLPGNTVVKIKLFSIFFDCVCAVAAGFLTEFIRREKNPDPLYVFDYRWFLAGFSLILFNPLAIFNSGFWGQCDPVYTAFVLWALYCTMKGKEEAAHILMGIGFAFKLQTVSALPFFLILYWVRKRFSLRKLLWIPIMMMVMDIPAYLAGYSVFTPFAIYLKQIRTNGGLYFYYPNIWGLFNECENYMFHSAGVMVTLALLASVVVLLVKEKIEPTWEQWMGILVWTTMTMMEFLPGMHDRYGYILETATLIYILVNPKRFWIAFGVFYCGAMGYFNINLRMGWNVEAASVAGLLGHALFTGVIIRDLVAVRKSEGEEEGTNAENKGGFFSGFDLALMGTVNRLIPALILFAGLFVCIIVRRPLINYFAPDGFGNFPGNELNLHTGFYNAIMSFVDAVAASKPIQFKLKLLSMMGDALAAALLWLYLLIPGKVRSAGISFLLWSILPLNLLNGALWGHVDGLCLSLILLGACVYSTRTDNRWSTMIPAVTWGMAAALEPRYLLLAMGYLLLVILGRRGKNDPASNGAVQKNGGDARKMTMMSVIYLITVLLCSLTGLMAGMDLGTVAVRMFSLTGHPTLLLYVVGAMIFAACFEDVRFVLPFTLLQTGLLMIWGSYLCGRAVWGLPIAWAECIAALILTGVYFWKRSKVM